MVDLERLRQKVNRAFASPERSNAESSWTLLAEYLIPNQSGIFYGGEETAGSKRTSRLFDSLPILANHDLATAYHATLTNPATKWSKLRFKDDELNNNKEALAWLEVANDTIHNAFNESNFDREISKSYKMFTALGTMAVMHETVHENGVFSGFKFKSLHLAEIAIAENVDGAVDTVYRKFRLTARQAVQKWGDRVSQDIKDAAKDTPEREFKFIHAVFPREADQVDLNDIGQAPANKRPFASVYIELGSGELMGEEEGFYEFPVYVPRWDTMPGEVYGRGPGHNALPCVRTLNKLNDIYLHSIARAAAPPMLTSMRNIIGSLNLRPNALTVARDPEGVVQLVPQARFDVIENFINNKNNNIKQAFFLDKLLLPPRDQTGEMTAFEIQKRLEQMQRVLGPTISRFSSEFLQPLIVRSFKSLLREGALPTEPAILRERGIDVDIVFLNQLSRAQQMDSLTNIQQWVNDIAALAQVKPEVLDYINADAIAKYVAKTRGVPEVVVENDAIVKQVREQRAQQQQAAMALEAGVKAADIAAKTNKGGMNGSPQFG